MSDKPGKEKCDLQCERIANFEETCGQQTGEIKRQYLEIASLQSKYDKLGQGAARYLEQIADLQAELADREATLNGLQRDHGEELADAENRCGAAHGAWEEAEVKLKAFEEQVSDLHNKGINKTKIICDLQAKLRDKGDC